MGAHAWHRAGVSASRLETQCRAQARGADGRCDLLQPGARQAFRGLWQVDAQGRLLRVDPSTGDSFQTGLQSPQLKGMELVSALEDRLQRVWLGI